MFSFWKVCYDIEFKVGQSHVKSEATNSHILGLSIDISHEQR